MVVCQYLLSMIQMQTSFYPSLSFTVHFCIFVNLYLSLFKDAFFYSHSKHNHFHKSLRNRRSNRKRLQKINRIVTISCTISAVRAWTGAVRPVLTPGHACSEPSVHTWANALRPGRARAVSPRHLRCVQCACGALSNCYYKLHDERSAAHLCMWCSRRPACAWMCLRLGAQIAWGVHYLKHAQPWSARSWAHFPLCPYMPRCALP